MRVLEARGVTVERQHFAAGSEFLLVAEAAQALGEQGFVAVVVDDADVSPQPQ